MSGLVLSLFPGIGLLDMAFEAEGFCVVRGPDLLWGGDVRRFHPPAGRFDGVIGGPPCQAFAPIGNVNRARYGEGSVMPDQIPEFARVLYEASPRWWVMENSPRAYGPLEPCRRIEVDNAWLGERQGRRRAFWSNLILHVETPCFGNQQPERTVCSKTVDHKGSRAREGERSLSDMLELQGAPLALFDHSPFTMQAKRKMIGNGVPIPMGRAVARAVIAALDKDDAQAS